LQYKLLFNIFQDVACSNLKDLTEKMFYFIGTTKNANSSASKKISVGVLVEFLEVWDLILEVELHEQIEDRHVFMLATNGQYSSKAVYEALFFLFFFLTQENCASIY
jgi:hypothetical protein